MNSQQPSAPQRRQFDRARVDLPVSYWVVGKDDVQEARIVDLSGGGVRISASADHPQGTQLELQFRLPKIQGEVVARGRIIMSFFEGTEGRYSHGVAFTQIAPADQDVIVQYIHDVQFPKLHGLGSS